MSTSKIITSSSSYEDERFLSGLGQKVQMQITSHAASFHENQFIPHKKHGSRLKKEDGPSFRVSGHNRLGDFYEQLHSLQFGGEDANGIISSLLEQKITQEDAIPPATSLMDLIDLNGRRFIEVKGCRVNSSSNLRDSQVQMYEQLQVMFPNWSLEFGMYCHRFDAVKSYDGDDRFLFSKLAKERTIYGVVIPFDVILQLYAHRDTNLVRRYVPKGDPVEGVHAYESCTCVNISAFRFFIS